MDHGQVATRVMRAVGGEENILGVAHCATRLRMVIKDMAKVDKKALENDPDLKGIFEAGGMFQVIVGPGDVNVVFERLTSMASRDIAVSTDKLKDIAADSGNWFTRAIKVLSDIFVPLIPILVGGGLLMALNNVLTAQDLFGPQSVVEMFPAVQGMAEMINLLASAPFAFLPVLVGYTATKRFGGNEFLGAGIAMAMVFPSLVNGYNVAEAIANNEMPYWDLFGLNVAQAGYQGSVLPVLVVSWLLATIEKFFHKHLKGTVDFLVTPVLTLLITGFLTFIAVGPAMRTVGDLLIVGLNNLYNFGGPIGGFLFGLVYSPIVITGLHQSFPPVELELFKQGGSFIFATASMANIAQGAVALAVFFLARSEKLKGLAGASGLSAVFGITEPAIFGVNLRLRWPFYIGVGAASIGGLLIALFQIKAVALGAAGFIGFVSIRAQDIPMFLVCAVIVFVISFVAAFVYGRYLISKNGSIDPDDTGTAVADTATTSTAAIPVASEKATRVASPLTGTAVALSDVSDETFASGMLGNGIAIEPTEGRLVSPIDGVVKVTFPSKHAYAISGRDADNNKVDVLMHIGFDTVNLGGKHFTSHVSKGDEVSAGDLLAEFDIEGIKEAGYPVTTPVVISNTKRVGAINPTSLFTPGNQVEIGAEVLTVEPKPKPQPTEKTSTQDTESRA